QPDAVAARGTGEEIAGRVSGDVRSAAMPEHGDRRVHAGAGLELPELLAGRRVKRGEPAVVAADEEQSPGRRDDAAVAGVGPMLLPDEAIRAHVERREHAVARQRGREERSADIERSRRRRLADRLGTVDADLV